MERKRDYRLQIQQRNLGERDSVTIRLDEPIDTHTHTHTGGKRVKMEDDEEEEDSDILALTNRGGGTTHTHTHTVEGAVSGASIFHTNLRVLVGEQPQIVDVGCGCVGVCVCGKRRLLQQQGAGVDWEGMSRASGWPLGVCRYKRCWEEVVASFFMTSTEARNRLAKTFYR